VAHLLRAQQDLGITAYLLTLWETLSPGQAQSFVDLGCGNGLLVYLLTCEGHRGTGYDLRERHIWHTFDPPVDLRVEAVDCASAVYPEHDWLIGNHSDELTPWIPIMAAKSSHKCRFFVLPCCPFDLHGRFQRVRSGAAQYHEYLMRVRSICTELEFDVGVGMLRIPSTRRTCFVSLGRRYADEPGDRERMTGIIANMVRAPAAEQSGFQARSAVIENRNCSTLPRAFLDAVVHRVAM
jgi:tRNASer (uridine44-2'-O)-methyltransferase